MKTSKKVIISGLVALLFLAIQPTSYAAQSLPCWIQRVEEHGGKLYIHFLPNYRQRAFVTTKSQERQDETSPSNTPNYLVAWEGETVSVSDGLHSGCKITVERHEQQLGLQTLAYVHVGRLPASETTEFIPAATHDESQQPK
jgi:hypothetical protein